MNILITSSSAKVLLVEDFVKAAHEFGLKAFTADISQDVASAFFSDGHFVLPRTTDASFVDQLACACKDEDIGLIIAKNIGRTSTRSISKRLASYQSRKSTRSCGINA